MIWNLFVINCMAHRILCSASSLNESLVPWTIVQRINAEHTIQNKYCNRIEVLSLLYTYSYDSFGWNSIIDNSGSKASINKLLSFWSLIGYLVDIYSVYCGLEQEALVTSGSAAIPTQSLRPSSMLAVEVNLRTYKIVLVFTSVVVI